MPSVTPQLTPSIALTLAIAWLTPVWASVGAPSADAPGCTDPAGLPRFEGARILGCTSSESAATVLPLGPWSDDPELSFWEGSVRLEGPRTALLYAAPPGRSTREVMRGYRKALGDLGFDVMFDCAGENGCGAGVGAFYADEAYEKRLPAPPAAGAFALNSVREPRILVAKGMADGASTYVFIFAAHQDNETVPEASKRVAIFLERVVSQGIEQHHMLLRTDELAQGIDIDGRVSVYGIAFGPDPNQADIAGESGDQLAEIARLLRERPELTLYVVGHTDNLGDLEQRLDLSRRQAEAVVAALVQDYGIAPERLSPHGVADLAPIAPQDSDEGRAMNRRIELVTRRRP